MLDRVAFAVTGIVLVVLLLAALVQLLPIILTLANGPN
jgi:hypothetical protein